MFYEAVQGNRMFDKDRRYADIDWISLDQVVDAFQKRIQDWYLEPARALAKNIHFAFSVMALNCLLIDTLSQFATGQDSSSAQTFKSFVRNDLRYSEILLQPIRHDRGVNTPLVLKDVADVFYHGYRCGILHQAHITPYGLVDPGGDLAVRQFPAGHLKYASGSDCASVVVNPLLVLEDLAGAFEKYLRDLKDRDPKHDLLRRNFKNKFSNSFGVDVTFAA